MYNKVSLFDTFNAKYLTFQEVSDSFIPNDEYYQLLGNNHTLIMGPRGCGKTTLLKMLTPAGLNYWKSDAAAISVRDNIPFTAVYIPSDIQWKSQLEFIEKHFGKENDLGEKITDFLIATNIQLAFCRTIHSFLQFDLSRESNQKMILEDDISREIIEMWGIAKPVSPTFDDIEIALQKRVIDINTLVNKFIFKKQYDRLAEELPDYVFNDFFDLIKIGCSIFEKKVGLDNHKWALCFDELEISPKFLQIKLLKYLRSVDQKYLFKLTTTPLFNLDNNLIEASQDNDFKTIKLWVYDDTGFAKWREFCSHLITRRIQRRFDLMDIVPEEVFGDYNLDEIIKSELGMTSAFDQGTGKGSSVNALFKQLAKNDYEFREFLEQRNIDYKDPYSRNPTDDKSIFLKHKVNVLYRLLYRNRTRKMPAIHYGIPHIYDLCDGNPRSVIGLADDILNRSEHDYVDKTVRIANSRQSELIYEVSKKYFSLIRNHPDSTLTIRGKEYNLATNILKPIGNYIYQKIVKDKFSRSIHTTFTVDSEIDQKVIRLLEHALFIGAIVYLDPVESLSNTGLVGKRFRLSYLLTPLFRIPNRVNSQVNLKTILSDSEDGDDQMSLDFN